MDFNLRPYVSTMTAESRRMILFGIVVIIIGLGTAAYLTWRMKNGADVSKTTFFALLFIALACVGVWGTLRGFNERKRRFYLSRAEVSSAGVRVLFTGGETIEIPWRSRAFSIEIRDDSQVKRIANAEPGDPKLLGRFRLFYSTGLRTFDILIPEEMMHATLKSAREFGLSVTEARLSATPDAGRVTHAIRPALPNSKRK